MGVGHPPDLQGARSGPLDTPLRILKAARVPSAAVPRELSFRARCPRCGEAATFMAVKIEKAVLTQEQVARGERPGFRGFRCLACRKVVTELGDAEGYQHRWEGDKPVAYPSETGLPEGR